MKYTLLELVQQILRSMDGDEVNSIADTEESEQVAHILKENFFNISGMLDLPEHYDFYELDATEDTTPVLMRLPDNAVTLDVLKYNQINTNTSVNNDLVQVDWMDFPRFMQNQESLNTDFVGDYSMTVQIGTASIDFKYRNDKHPQWYTTWDNHSILFDSYNSVEDAFLQKNKTQCYGLLSPTWVMTDTAVPDLDARQFQLLLQSAKSQCFLELRQQANPIAAKREKDNMINAQRTKRGIPAPWAEYNNLPNYGRRGRYPSDMQRAMRKGQ